MQKQQQQILREEGIEQKSSYNKKQLEMQENIISYQELAKHNNMESIWVAIAGKVYDLTKFYHPGGKKVLIKCSGKDSTEEFLRQHSNPLYMEHFQDFKIGVLPDFEEKQRLYIKNQQEVQQEQQQN
ncbi:Cytochrome b5-like heme/steroid binding domain [Pseudocohnilembus persalinus]|uniref:Cytochrome b5-like heme/steroid binding domain n=1 Tax=Pseudocohnilembus persalinus TaxID=266149 RepID=A0A0V0QDR0_PSEPJ|nr:Cytochrome b5-like heme/steroid binding domain [Pseudocohnilembus persalinus]|eukprot:KRX00294.1 Cytochrome b5-like heme/steroid binding domain [Pseudocohnilembus persalinus]